MAKKKRPNLTEEDQERILKLFTENLVSIRELAVQFHLSISGIRNVLNNKRSQVVNHRALYGRNEQRVEDYIDEVWMPLQLETITKYEISNYGRIKSYYLNKNGTLIKGKMNAGYLQFDYHIKGANKGKSILIHRLVAIHFIPKPSEEANAIVHIDGNKANNRVSNLKWVTRAEASSFGLQVNPNMNKERELKRTKGVKLTLGKVEMIRRLLADPNRTTRKKMIAKQFGISEMTLYRIQNGEMWANKGTQLEYTRKNIYTSLPKEKVIAVKKLLTENKLTQKQIAINFNLSESVVSRIKQGKTYKDIN